MAPATPIPGAPGAENWTYKAVKSGTTSIFMQYSQPWTGDTKGAQSIAVSVVIPALSGGILVTFEVEGDSIKHLLPIKRLSLRYLLLKPEPARLKFPTAN
jgi:hypothetical protein